MSEIAHFIDQCRPQGGFLRQLQDRVKQANTAGYEIKNIDKQMLTQQIRINIAEQEIINQQKQIDNAQEVEEFLRNKYTNRRTLFVDGRPDQDALPSGLQAGI